MEILETERLILRGFRQSDLDDLFAYAQNPSVGPAAGWKPHESREESRRVLDMFMEQGDVWALEYRASGHVIGSLGLHRDPKRPGANARMLGYVLAQEHWGQGLMTEAARRAVRYAFEVLGVEVLSVYRFPFNGRSARVIEKCGFVPEGTLRRSYKRYDGAVLDEQLYSLLREEYFAALGGCV